MKKKVDEIIRIADRLDEDETVLMVIRQTKNPLKPGGSLFTPNTIFATTKKIIIRNPSALGLRHNIESYSYHKIVDVKLEKGMFSSAIEVNVPGSVYDGIIDAIPKDEAEKLLKIIYGRIEKVNKPAPSDDDSLIILKKRYAKGEITKEEFDNIKKDLEESHYVKKPTSSDETQFWVCPHCGIDTQNRNGKQFCSKCNVYL